MITPEPIELEIAAQALRAHADRLFCMRADSPAQADAYEREAATCDAVAAWLDAKAARAARRRIAKPSDAGHT